MLLMTIDDIKDQLFALLVWMFVGLVISRVKKYIKRRM